MPHPESLPPRRHFLGTLALAGAALTIPGIGTAAPRPARPATGPDDWDHSWLKRLNRKHQLVFDTKGLGGTEVFGYPTRYLDAMESGYGAKPADTLAVIGLHGTAWPAVLDDERWNRYGIGSMVSVIDPVTGAPSLRNTLRVHEDPARTTLATVQARDAVVIVCNNTLRRVSRDLADADSGRLVDQVYADLRAGILPGVTVVPAMVAALEMAQSRGCSYVLGAA